MTELDNQIVHYNAITNRSSNLARVINSKLNDRETLLRKIYLKSNLDKKLYYAVIANDIRFAQKLILKFNADVNSVYGPSKYSLLQISIILGYYDMMKLLLKHKADVSYKNNDGDTAFDLSIKERNVAANKFMIAISVATNKIAFFQKQK
jgi:ankyrin repeat protein